MFAYDFAALKASHKDCIVRSSHQVALQKEQDDLSWVKLELEQMKKAKANAETALAEERSLRAEETKELRAKLEEDSARANSLEKQMDALKVKPNEWLAELKWINEKLSSESLFWTLSPSFFKCTIFDSAILTR